MTRSTPQGTSFILCTPRIGSQQVEFGRMSRMHSPFRARPPFWKRARGNGAYRFARPIIQTLKSQQNLIAHLIYPKTYIITIEPLFSLDIKESLLVMKVPRMRHACHFIKYHKSECLLAGFQATPSKRPRAGCLRLNSTFCVNQQSLGKHKNSGYLKCKILKFWR